MTPRERALRWLGYCGSKEDADALTAEFEAVREELSGELTAAKARIAELEGLYAEQSKRVYDTTMERNKAHNDRHRAEDRAEAAEKRIADAREETAREIAGNFETYPHWDLTLSADQWLYVAELLRDGRWKERRNG